VIEKLTRFDIAILVAAAVMALGAFCPIVRFPFVGSINYVMGVMGIDGTWRRRCTMADISENGASLTEPLTRRLLT
jgi:hypothetical protein